MFLDLNKKDSNAKAFIESEGDFIKYGELISFSEEFSGVIEKRSLIFICLRIQLVQ